MASEEASEGRPGISDEELLMACQRGDPDALPEVIRRHERGIYSYLRRYTRDPVLAEDVFQDTFLKVHEKIGQYQEGRPARPWLYTIATHQAVDALRRAKRRRGASLDESRDRAGGGEGARLADAVESHEDAPSERMERGELAERMRAAVDMLPDLYREVLILAYYHEMKYQDIGEVLGLPLGTVKSRMHAAMGKLAEILKGATPSGTMPALKPRQAGAKP
jgi:RNA polymerase sigma-70 factor (ECF subfamily)